MYFLLFKPAALSVFCGAIDAICICTETSRVTTVSRVMYGNFSCYHSLYGFVVGTRMVLQALLTGVSNHGYGGYTIYGSTDFDLLCRSLVG